MRQNLVLFIGGLLAGLGSFVYHAIAGRMLGPAAYGQVAFLISAYALGMAPAAVLSVLLARYTARMAAERERTLVRSLVTRMTVVVGIAGLMAFLVIVVLARSVAAFEHLGSMAPVIFLGLCVALGWQLSVPRGVLQGLQRFRAFAFNLALEPIARALALFLLLVAGYAVSGAIGAVLAGLGLCLTVGFYSLRDALAQGGGQAHLRPMANYALAAAAGIIGIQCLFSQDVILAEHYLPGHEGGIYGGLNKIGTIVFYLTLSVSQVLFPRVVEAVAKEELPWRILLYSVGLVVALGAGALVVFALMPGLIVSTLYGAAFSDATPYVFAVGAIGVALSVDNLLIQFFMAMHDRWFVPILGIACVSEAVFIVLFHETVTQVVTDVLSALTGLMLLLGVRCYWTLRAPQRRPSAQSGVLM